MSDKNFYYIKPRGDKKISYRGLPENQSLEKADDYAVVYSTKSPSQSENYGPILDMSFDKKSIGHTAILTQAGSHISFGRLLLTTAIVVVMYMGGFAVYAQASSLKDNINSLATKGMSKLEVGAQSLGAKDFQKATDNFTAAENLFTQANQEILRLGQSNLYMSEMAGNNFQIITGTKLIDSGLNLARGGKTLVVAMNPTFQYFNALETQPVVATDIPTQIVGLLSTARPELDKAVGQVTRAHTLLSEIDPNKVDPNYREAIIEAQGKTSALNQAVGILGTLSQELPQALGFNNPRKYLLLNQNSNELRATGGFIGSFSIITLHKGQITDVFVDITQRIDGQNPKPSLELPAPLRSISVTGAWGTRDANWSPDFPTSAKTFQKLYEEGGGGTVDGIIAVNPKLIESLLTITGPIDLPVKGETVTAQNFVDLTQEYTQFIDNKTENPKAILSELAPILMDKILKLPASEIVKVNEILSSLLTSKDLMIYTRNQKLENALATLNYAGTMPTIAEDQDFLAVIRSNLGARKSSGKVASRINHTVNVNLSRELETTLNLTFTHQGVDEFPDGPNKDYIRIYTPLGSRLISADNLDEGTKVDVTEEEGKTVFGIWVTTNPGQTRDVVVKYQPNVELHDSYQLKIFKQSGDESWLVSSLRASAGVNIADESSKSKQLFDGKLLADQFFTTSLGWSR